jgi:hypothetical protein
MELDDLLRTPLGRDLEKKVLNGIHALALSEPNAEPVRLSRDDTSLGRHCPNAVRIATARHVQITPTVLVHDTDLRGQGGARGLDNPTRGQPIDDGTLKGSVADPVVPLWKSGNSTRRHNADRGGK